MTIREIIQKLTKENGELKNRVKKLETENLHLTAEKRRAVAELESLKKLLNAEKEDVEEVSLPTIIVESVPTVTVVEEQPVVEATDTYSSTVDIEEPVEEKPKKSRRRKKNNN